MSTGAVSHEPMFTLPPELRPEVELLVTEDDKPVDGIFSEKQHRLLIHPLYASWPGPGGGRPFIALTNVGLFYQVKRPPLVPDAMLSVDVKLITDQRLKSSKSYFVWDYHKLPEVVVEVVSNREGGEDTEKFEIYSQMGVPYYAIYDPKLFLGDEALRVFRLEDATYARMKEPIWFPEVNLGLRIWKGLYEDMVDVWLRWVDAQDRLIPTGKELAEVAEALAETAVERADLATKRAEMATKQADMATKQAEAERRRADQLAELLRKLGVEPKGS